MKVSVAVVTSLDGKMTRQDEADISDWASKEDHDHFMSLLRSSDSIVMGSTTYELMRPQMQLRPENMRVILTSRPEEYEEQAVTGQLEFHNKSPQELVHFLEGQGKQDLLIVGGGQMITDFLKAGLVDTIYLTLEPRYFGEGKPVITEAMNQELKLVDCKQVNESGTLILTYKVV